MSEHPPTSPNALPGGEVSAPAAENEHATPITVTRHRQCISCGYDLYSLATTGLCAECGTPVARTLAVNTLSELDAKSAWRWVIGVRLLLISAIVSVAAVPAIFAIGFLAGIGGDLVAIIMAYAIPVGVYVCYFFGCGFASSDALVPKWTRLALLAGLGLASVCMIAWILVANSSAGSTRGRESVVCVFLMGQCVCTFVHFLAFGGMMEHISVRAGRDATTRMCRTFKWYTIVWHALELVLVLVVIAMILIHDDQWIMGPGVAWLFSWIGHAAWVITGLVVTARLLSAGRHERAFGTAAAS